MDNCAIAIDDDAEHKNFINFFIECKDPMQQKLFVEFKQSLFGRHFLTYTFAVIITLLFAIYWGTVMYLEPTPFSIFTLLFTFTIPFPLLWGLTVLKQSVSSVPPQQYHRSFLIAENGLLLFSSVAMGLTVLARAFSKSCSHLSAFFTWTCTPFYGLPEFIIILLFLPLLCSVTLPTIKGMTITISYIWSLAIIIYAINQVYGIYVIPWMITALIIAIKLSYITSSFKMQLYKYFLKVKALQGRREEDARQLT
jgi:hypothetical protein